MCPNLFRDFDDVICLNNQYGGYDALTALAEAGRHGTLLRAEDELAHCFGSSLSAHYRCPDLGPGLLGAVSRYRSTTLALIIMANIPLALVGSVIAMWLSGVTLSVASMVGFITLTGIAVRNGILKVSHYSIRL